MLQKEITCAAIKVTIDVGLKMLQEKIIKPILNQFFSSDNILDRKL